MSAPGDGSRRPSDTDFKQQRLRAWQPILSPTWVISCFFIVAGTFIPIGALVIVASDDVKEIELRYDDKLSGCKWVTPEKADFCLNNCTNSSTPGCGQADCGMVGSLGEGCPRRFSKDRVISRTDLPNMDRCDPKCNYTLTFNLTEPLDPPIYMYYKLTSFYQNHRRYAKSRSDLQLSGESVGGSDVEDCPPLKSVGDMPGCQDDLGMECGDVPVIGCSELEPDSLVCKTTTDMKQQKLGDYMYNPCGLVAWSRFNDSFVVKTAAGEEICDGNNPKAGLCEKEGIAWDADRTEKFKEPPADEWDSLKFGGMKKEMQCVTGGGQCSTYLRESELPALPYLYHGWYLWEPYHKVPQTPDEDFMVWMRTASLPTFRKLYRKITKPDGLGVGMYTIEVDHRFDTSAFSGEKYIVLTTLTWVGGKNYFLGVTYIAIGSLCVLLGSAFMAKHLCFRGSRQEIPPPYSNPR